MNIILERRSIRKYTNERVSREEIEKLIEAAYSAPSACNKKPFKIYVITNEEVLNKLDKSGRYTNMHSPLIIVVCGDMKKALPRYLKEYWIQDASAVSQNILLASTSLGLGSCWCGVYLQEDVMKNVSEILNLDEDTIPFSLIHIGHPNEEKQANSGYDKEMVEFID